MKTYTINEIFCSLQGEGIRAGTLNHFVRFSGCNQTCKVETHGFDCDTEFASGRKLTADEIVAECRRLNPLCRAAILTGGEPLLQVDAALLNTLHEAGFYIALETNGSVAAPVGFDWITVSPKVAEHCVRQLNADEVKYVRAYGQGIPKTVVEAKNYLLSPAFNGLEIDRESLVWCVKLVKENPVWRLSIQQHKGWKVR